MFSVYLLTLRILEFFRVVILMDFFIELILFVFSCGRTSTQKKMVYL